MNNNQNFSTYFNKSGQPCRFKLALYFGGNDSIPNRRQIYYGKSSYNHAQEYDFLAKLLADYSSGLKTFIISGYKLEFRVGMIYDVVDNREMTRAYGRPDTDALRISHAMPSDKLLIGLDDDTKNKVVYAWQVRGYIRKKVQGPTGQYYEWVKESLSI